jgi:hypothetical protein
LGFRLACPENPISKEAQAAYLWAQKKKAHFWAFFWKVKF